MDAEGVKKPFLTEWRDFQDELDETQTIRQFYPILQIPQSCAAYKQSFTVPAMGNNPNPSFAELPACILMKLR